MGMGAHLFTVIFLEPWLFERNRPTLDHRLVLFSCPLFERRAWNYLCISFASILCGIFYLLAVAPNRIKYKSVMRSCCGGFMRVEISGKKIKLDEGLKSHVDRRLHFALKKFSTDVERIAVTIDDGGSGVDKRCLIIVKLLHSLGRVTIEDSGHDIFAVVARAADRAGNAVGRAIGRKRDKKYQRRRAQAAEVPEPEDSQDTE